MLHARTDYDAIQDPRPDGIGADEPVFILRAKDIHAPATLRGWCDMAIESGADPEMVGAVRKHALAMEEWQERNGSKVPDTPREYLRV